MNQLIKSFFIAGLLCSFMSLGAQFDIGYRSGSQECQCSYGRRCDPDWHDGDKGNPSDPNYSHPHYDTYYGYPSQANSNSYSYPSYGQYEHSDGGISLINYKFR
ncbi:hypothetical protein [Candidatus Protochlamydia sp. R18]|uniref:hypothetical protein n=1 Tax=Candidatus Protochlamydia sp. R18 TaxID=1353977 RepID=UPI0005A6F59F|nr:hypothetical protein [Candidatus Protochlamydia sp. R18]